MTQAGLRRRELLGLGLALAIPGIARAAEVTPRIRKLAPGLDRILDPATPIETIATGIQWAEGPVWSKKGDYLLFSDPPANVIRRWCRKYGLVEFMRPSGLANPDPATIREPGSNGLAIDAKGRLIVADSGSRALVAVDLPGKTRTILADRYQGKHFNSVNDVHITRSRAIYFTDPPYGLVGGDDSPLKELPHNGVYRRAPDGTLALIDASLTRPNGVALSPDEKRLFVANSDKETPHIVVYDLDKSGMPTGRQIWLDCTEMARSGAPGSQDGMKIAADGTHFNSVPGGMMVLTPDAEPLGLIETGAPIANCAFGEDGRTLFLTANDRILRLRMKINGWRA